MKALVCIMVLASAMFVTAPAYAEFKDCGMKKWTDGNGDMHWQGVTCADSIERSSKQQEPSKKARPNKMVNDISPQEKAKNKLAKMGKSFTAHGFIQCVENGAIDTVKLFLDAGMDVNVDDDGATAFSIAIVYNRHDVIRLLVQRGARWTHSNMITGISVACLPNNMRCVDTMKLLFELGFEVANTDIGFIDEMIDAYKGLPFPWALSELRKILNRASR